ncbi:MAG: CoA pyrophosphatase [Spirochaetes bacterium]|nr:CoA pyrophosphatase [Spirochaetota bacterium]
MQYGIKEIKEKLAFYHPSHVFYREKYHAAVIIPLIEINNDIQILFEVRSESLSRHPGQVGFPGGGIETGESPLEAALREMEEECGIGKNDVEIFGALDTVESITGTVVSSFVCGIDECITVKPDNNEVAEVFTVPLIQLKEEGFRESRVKEVFTLSDGFPVELLKNAEWRHEYTYPVYYYQYDKYLIWGLTARILKHFVEIVS